MTQTVYKLFIKALEEIAKDVVTLTPKLFLTIIIFTITVIVIKLLNKVFSKLLSLVDLDGSFKKFVRVEPPFSLNNLVIFLIDVGILFIALLGMASLTLTPQQLELIQGIINYGTRILSVAIITILTFVMFNALIDKVRIETRMRGYVLFILLIIITAMLIDLTNLSVSTKTALVEGLSLGLGIAVGVFAFWFFFHEYLDAWVKAKTKTP